MRILAFFGIILLCIIGLSAFVSQGLGSPVIELESSTSNISSNCPSQIEFKTVLRTSLRDFFASNQNRNITTNKIKDVLNFYLEVDDWIEANCEVKGNSTQSDINTLFSNLTKTYSLKCKSKSDCGEDKIWKYACKNGEVHAITVNYSCPRMSSSISSYGCQKEVNSVLVDTCSKTERCIEGESNCQTIPSCNDGTLHSQCSLNKPLYCNSGNLINNCSSCGCKEELVCINNVCVTPSWENCEECGEGVFNLCDKEECHAISEGCYFEDGASRTCTSCVGITCDSYIDSDDCNTDLCSKNCVWNTAKNSCIEKVCTAGTRQCSGNILQICSADSLTWANQDCLTSGYCDLINKTCLNCSVGMLNCDGLNNNGCEINKKEDIKNCGNCNVHCSEGQYCNMGVCSNQRCIPNSKQCLGTLWQTCNVLGSDWTTTTDCNLMDKKCDASLGCVFKTCSDGTPYGGCSLTKPLYCNNGNLINNCSSCGCLVGICKNNGACNFDANIKIMTSSNQYRVGESVSLYKNKSSMPPIEQKDVTSSKISKEYSGYIIELSSPTPIEFKKEMENLIEQKKKEIDASNSLISKTLDRINLAYLERSKEGKLKNHLEDVKREHENVKNKIISVIGKKTAEGDVTGGFFKQEFYQVINGFALDISDEEAEKLTKLKEIKKISPNMKVYASIYNSTPLIKANEVWQLQDGFGRNITGKDVTVAVVDTGVDYNHPDFGSCFGEYLYCGDGRCMGSENVTNCLEDCYYCGNGICESPFEDSSVCQEDCSICGDGYCGKNENHSSCPSDCCTTSYPEADHNLGMGTTLYNNNLYIGGKLAEAGDIVVAFNNKTNVVKGKFVVRFPGWYGYMPVDGKVNDVIYFKAFDNSTQREYNVLNTYTLKNSNYMYSPSVNFSLMVENESSCLGNVQTFLDYSNYSCGDALCDSEYENSDNCLADCPTDSGITVSLIPDEDATLWEGYENEFNFADYLFVGKDERYQGIRRTFLRFDLNHLKGKEIKIAQLHLRAKCSSNKSNPPIIQIYEPKSIWNETSIKWGSIILDKDSNIETSDARRANEDYYTFNLTRLVKKWAGEDANYGILMISSKEEQVDCGNTFYSKDYKYFHFDKAFLPHLIINYESRLPGISGKTILEYPLICGDDICYQDELENCPEDCKLCDKIIGGWDFANNDGIPLDDNGHGTHVAGIIAGNDNITGVAPDAKIYAYKVLNSNGEGSFAEIIAGIDRATDPDNDGDSRDRADVISISLGANCWGHYSAICGPDDPASRAVDNAVDIGSVVVVSAGNSGPNSKTLGTPGTARKAITVGATNNLKEIASFSSRGPVITEREEIHKPDLSAPGVLICSSLLPGFEPWNLYNPAYARCLDSQHVRLSGTSMSTPMVSGAAALLRQKYPAMNPLYVKELLKESSEKLIYDVDTYGEGFLNINKSLNLEISVLSIENYSINDSEGNNNGQVDNGEKISLAILLKAIYHSVQNKGLYLTAENSCVSILNSSKIIDINGDEQKEFIFNLETNCNSNETIYFNLNYDNGLRLKTETFRVITSSCGDKFCDSDEDYHTCAIDCLDSFIYNNDSGNLVGQLGLNVQKIIEGNWIDNKIVYKSNRIILPGVELDLQKIWAESGGYTTISSGLFRVYGEFKDDYGNIIITPNGFLNASYEFTVN